MKLLYENFWFTPVREAFFLMAKIFSDFSIIKESLKEYRNLKLLFVCFYLNLSRSCFYLLFVTLFYLNKHI